MPRRSAVYIFLDDATRDELDRRIIAAGFGSYAEHAAWLAGQGHAISVSALQRYGAHLRDAADSDRARASEAKAAAMARVRYTTEVARAIQAAAGGDAFEVAERTGELCAARLYEMAAKEDIDAKTLESIARTVNGMLQAMTSIRTERQAVLREASKAAGEEARRRGLSPAAEAAIRAAVEGSVRAEPPNPA